MDDQSPGEFDIALATTPAPAPEPLRRDLLDDLLFQAGLAPTPALLDAIEKLYDTPAGEAEALAFEILLNVADALRSSVFGTAFARVLRGHHGESLKEAAERLRRTETVICRTEKLIRSILRATAPLLVEHEKKRDDE
jgi:hypothetical protein